MSRVFAFVAILALGGGVAHAGTPYCRNPTTHKRMTCKTATPPASASTPSKTVPATKPVEPAYKPAPSSRP